MRRPQSPQITVVPFVDPPVGTLGRPFIIFFFRSIIGSSHDPARVAVAENSLTLGMLADALGGERSLREAAEAKEGRNAVAGDILSPWKALSSADEALCFIVARFGRDWLVVVRSIVDASKIHMETKTAEREHGPIRLKRLNPNPLRRIPRSILMSISD